MRNSTLAINAQTMSSGIEQSDRELLSNMIETVGKITNSRGLKKCEFSSYLEATTEKIEELKRAIADPSVPKKTKYRYRNKISAYQCRLNQRTQEMELAWKEQKIDDKIKRVLKVTASVVSPEQMKMIQAKIAKIGEMRPD